MISVTVIIHTFNEESGVKDAIQSAQNLTNQIILIDSGSIDKTVTIAKNLGVKIYTYHSSLYVEPARNFGISKVDTDWLLILDADERVTKELSDEIKKQIKDADYTHYRIPRKNLYGRIKWLKHGGWWPDHQIRLINKKFFKAWPKEIHSTPIIGGNIGYLKNPLLHYFHGDIEAMVNKTIIFEDIESDLLLKADKKANTLTFFRKFMGELYRRLIKNLGFLDGDIGIIESVYQAFSKTVTYLFLYEKKNRSTLRSLP